MPHLQMQSALNKIRDFRNLDDSSESSEAIERVNEVFISDQNLSAGLKMDN